MECSPVFNYLRRVSYDNGLKRTIQRLQVMKKVEKNVKSAKEKGGFGNRIRNLRLANISRDSG